MLLALAPGGEVPGLQDPLHSAADHVIALEPGLGIQPLVLGDKEDDVLGPINLGPEIFEPKFWLKTRQS